MIEQISTTDIKKIIASKNLIIGTDRTIKALKLGTVEIVVMGSNCAEDVIEDVKRYASFSKAKVLHVSYPNEELGVLCKKPFPISVLSVARV